MNSFNIGNLKIGDGNLFFIAGPCVIESYEHTISIAERLVNVFSRVGMPFIFKASYDKANRSSISSYRGPGIEKGLAILKEVKNRFNLPILTDVHEVSHIKMASKVVDVLQVPAFLSRQTDLLLAAGLSGKAVNVKKGQFLAPWDMANVVEKITSTGNHKIILTERGFSFGYNNLVVDFRSFPIMRKLGYPVVFDATHSVQLPGGSGKASGGNSEFIFPLSRAAVACGIDGVFFEVHDNPRCALCDGPNALHIDDFEKVVKTLISIHEIHTGGYGNES